MKTRLHQHFITIPLLFLSLILQSQNYSKDVKMGQKAAKQVEQEMGFYKHEPLEKLIASVGQKLVDHLEKSPQEFKFQFHLVDAEEPNAFALPGGYIYVTRGILPLIQTEDELAGIIGHEMIHVLNRHSVRQFNREIFPAVLKLPGNLINGITRTRLGNIINVPIDLITQPFIAKYSRKHESESDRLGIELAAKAGYNPADLANALDRLTKEMEVLTGEAEKRSYYNDHPYTPHRVENILKWSKNLKPSESEHLYSSQQKFLQNMNGLCFGTNPKNGVFIDSLFVQPDMGFSMIMPSKWDNENGNDLVTSHNKEHKAAIALSLVNDKKSAKTCGEELTKKVKKSGSTVIEFSGDTTLNKMPAYLVRVNSKQKGEEVTVEVLWVEMKGLVYQIEGVCVKKERTVTAASMRSFKPLNENELSQVRIHEFELVSANENESVEELSKRTNNKLNPQLTLIFNDLKKSSKLPANKPVKILSQKPYRP